MPPTLSLLTRWLGRVEYEPTWQRMQAFTDTRTPETVDELWLLEHPPVFTLGRNARPEHLLDPHGIPAVQVDRGGQVTWHGPGQLVAYLLLDLKRAGLGIRPLVELLEQSVIDLLAEGGIEATGRRDAPGVYVQGRKIAALGLRVRRGASYHGLALNVDADLTPFGYIDPCGYPGLEVTRMKDLGFSLSVRATGERLATHLGRLLGYTVEHVE